MIFLTIQWEVNYKELQVAFDKAGLTKVGADNEDAV